MICNMKKIFPLAIFLSLFTAISAQTPKAPIMGWSSWNNFRVHIDEQMIREQADAMVSSGMYAAGYRYINIDDGYFGGRDKNGELVVNKKKFPSGMKALVNYIHAKGLRAGIYSDAGISTCGSIYDKDSNGIAAGLYGHVQADCKRFFQDWKFDFLKVDWCGGEKLKLNEETAYTSIIDTVRAIDSNVVFNICRWKFPGTWAIRLADSWRISGDIDAKFSSILHIIDLNADLYKYASPGHYNDMDMLQVGRGMTYEEDKSHFSMWCMLNSPLLAGNDLRHMSKQTLEILTNRELIALNQDKGFVQARRLLRMADVEVWKKPLGNDGSNTCAIALLNRSDKETTFQLNPDEIGLTSKSRMRDLWKHKNLGRLGKQHSFLIPPHGIIVLKINSPA